MLLLIIAKIGDPSATSDLESNLIESIEQKQKALFNVRGETRELDERLKSRQEQLSELNQRIARLKEQLASVSKQAAELAQSQSEEKQNLQTCTPSFDRRNGTTSWTEFYTIKRFSGRNTCR